MKIQRVTEGRVGPALRANRLELQMSQADLERATGIPKPRISRYENGFTLPTIDSLYLLCEGLQTTPSQLLAEAGL